ncbi:hypothetical protein KQI65_00210 [bacterium]|nr:hypothetical protein [bacterium]
MQEVQLAGFSFVKLEQMASPSERMTGVVSMRHDVDSSLMQALRMAQLEHDIGVSATYFILHTANYFKTRSDGGLEPRTLEKVLYMQNELGHEIGLHLDLMHIQFFHEADPEVYLKDQVQVLRSQGVHIVGVSPHGNMLRNVYRKGTPQSQSSGSENVFIDSHRKLRLDYLQLKYEAYSVDRDLYFSDASFIGGKRWKFSDANVGAWEEAARVIVLTHPIHWAESAMKYYTLNMYYDTMYAAKYMKEYLDIRKGSRR